METNDVVRALGALAQENRLAIYRLLVRAGAAGRAVGEIAETLDVANATLSFHLKELASAGLIDARQDGRFIYYSADYAQMNELLEFLTENCCEGGACGPVCATARIAKPANGKTTRTSQRRAVTRRR